MYRFIFEILTDPLGLPIHALWEYGILLILETAAYIVAWRVSPGGALGSLIHWFVRFLAFFALWALSYAVMAAVLWVIAHWQLALTAVITAVVVYFAAFIMIKGFFCNAAHDEQHHFKEVRL